jgi:hypothetical protein
VWGCGVPSVAGEEEMRDLVTIICGLAFIINAVTFGYRAVAGDDILFMYLSIAIAAFGGAVLGAVALAAYPRLPMGRKR